MRTALVLGGAACVWEDVDAALDLTEAQGTVACNDVGAAWPGDLDAWVTLHPEKMAAWSRQRADAGHKSCDRIISQHDPRPSRIFASVSATTDFRFMGQTASGSSGLFALKVALIDLGFDRAILCGVPLVAADKHFFDAKEWRGATAHRQGWKEALPEIAERARSMSGWTAQLLGQPTEDWLAG